MTKCETDQLIGELSTILEIEPLLIPTPKDQDIVNRVSYSASEHQYANVY